MKRLLLSMVIGALICVIVSCAGARRQMPEIRSVDPPDAPIADSVRSQVVNIVCIGDCYAGGRRSWLRSDFSVAWSHPDPIRADGYEVYCATDEPYFDPDYCERCQLAGITTGLRLLVVDAPPGFNPVGSTEGAEISSRLTTCVVRAFNAGGVSKASNEIGAINFSLLQGVPYLPEP